VDNFGFFVYQIYLAISSVPLLRSVAVKYGSKQSLRLAVPMYHDKTTGYKRGRKGYATHKPKVRRVWQFPAWGNPIINGRLKFLEARCWIKTIADLDVREVRLRYLTGFFSVPQGTEVDPSLRLGQAFDLNPVTIVVVLAENELHVTWFQDGHLISPTREH
jgi:hypothetical protein